MKRTITPLPLLAAVCFWIYPGSSAFASESDNRGADTTLNQPYLSLGVAVVRPESLRFVDGGDAGHAALYGGEEFFDAGKIGEGAEGRFAAGVPFGAVYRLQLEYNLARDLAYSGNANYTNSGEYQPSTAELDTRQVLLAAFRDFPNWEYAPGRALRPFLGIGAGITKFRLGEYRQQFPSPPNPNGGLRRGPGGEIPYTAIPPGSDSNFTAMLAAGASFPVGENMELELSYRYTDAGEIHSNVGAIEIVRYRADGSRREIPVTINETTTDFRTHSLSLSLRFQW